MPIPGKTTPETPARDRWYPRAAPHPGPEPPGDAHHLAGFEGATGVHPPSAGATTLRVRPEEARGGIEVSCPGGVPVSRAGSREASG